MVEFQRDLRAIIFSLKLEKIFQKQQIFFQKQKIFSKAASSLLALLHNIELFSKFLLIQSNKPKKQMKRVLCLNVSQINFLSQNDIKSFLKFTLELVAEFIKRAFLKRCSKVSRFVNCRV